MGKKKKKAGRGKKVIPKNLSLPQLVEKGAALLAADKPRDAIPLLKTAFKNGGDQNVRSLLFKAYSLRANQLKCKDMVMEAKVVQRHAIDLIPDPGKLSEPELLMYLDIADTQTALNTCCAYINTNKSALMVEQKFAGLLVLTEKWDALGGVSRGSMLRRDAEPVKQAVDMMNSGQWEAALEILKPVSRSSPYAPVRMLCRVMVCFYEEDAAGMKRALSLIPEASPFYPVAEKLIRTPQEITCLWDRPVYALTDVQVLITHLKQHQIKPAAAYIQKFSYAVCPEHPEIAMLDILQSCWPMTVKNILPRNMFQRLSRSLLSGRMANLLLAKFDYFHFELDIEDTAQYLEKLPIEFTNETHHNAAASMILTHTVHRIKTQNLYINHDSLSAADKKLLGIESEEPSHIEIELLLKAIDLDPTNRPAYALLSEQPRDARVSKNLVESGLEKMLLAFPEDPFPCLELATLYYEKNAFRKAQDILKKAKQRAPHDDRVIDHYVLSLLISMDKRIERKKIQLAAEDLETARKRCNERTLPIVSAKAIFYEWERLGQLSLFGDTTVGSPKALSTIIRNTVSNLTPYQRLKTIGLLAVDLVNRNITNKTAYTRELDNIFKYCQKDIHSLTSSEIRALLVPLNKELLPLVHSRHQAGAFLNHYKGMLHHLGDADIIPVLDALAAEGLFNKAEAEIQRRLKHSNHQAISLLKFYLVVVRHLSGKLHNDVDAFDKVVEQTPETQKELLRAAGRRLSSYASGNLKRALSSFDFDELDCSDLPFEDISPPFLEDSDGPEDMSDILEYLMEAGEDIHGMSPSIFNDLIEKLVAEVEEIIDDLGLRGAPRGVILEYRNDLKKQTKGPWLFDFLASLLDNEQIANLSKESWEFLFGKP